MKNTDKHMKANKIYLIKFENIDDSDLTHPVFNEITTVLNKRDLEYVGVTQNDDIFLRLYDYKVEKVVNILKKYFTFEVTDVTALVKSGVIQKEYPEVEFLTPKLFKNFRLETTSKDEVLDKISKDGIDSLDKLDKKILKK